jgi:hypothetical protein
MEEIPESVRRKYFDVLGYLTCGNTRREWGEELPELLRPGPEGSQCRTGMGLCECLSTGEPCLFGNDEGTSGDQQRTPEG